MSDEIASSSKANIFEGFFELNLQKQVILLVGIAGTIALAIYIALWSQNPNYVPLYNSMNPSTVASIVEALSRNNVQYKFDDKTGLVLVDQSKVHEARISLAKDDINPQAGVGLELLDKNASLGTSNFVERTRFLRGLQGELERTITAISQIKSARVHLAIPKQSDFLNDKKKPSASVFIDIQGGQRLEPENVAGIQNLVASSIQGLSSDNVTIIDQTGALLTGAGSSEMAILGKQLGIKQQTENLYAKRIIDLLTPIVGPGRVKAQVTADIDFTSLEETSENYDTDKQAVRSERIVNMNNNAQSEQTFGVPGSLSNQAPLTSQNQNQDPSQDNGLSLSSGKNQATRNYELDRKIQHQKKHPGKLLKMSVAVLVDNKVSYSNTGKATKTALEEKEIKNIEALVKNTIGFDSSRGDTISVINESFLEPAPIEEPKELSIFEKPWFNSAVKQSIAAVIFLILIAAVLRPMFKNLLSVSAVKNKYTQEISKLKQTDQGSIIGINSKESELMQIANLVKDDPQKAAYVIKQWINKDE